MTHCDLQLINFKYISLRQTIVIETIRIELKSKNTFFKKRKPNEISTALEYESSDVTCSVLAQ